MTARSPLTDACPACFPGDHPAVSPSSEPASDGNGSLRASYTCPSCGHSWACWWDAKAAGWPLRTGPVPLAELIRLAPGPAITPASRTGAA